MESAGRTAALVLQRIYPNGRIVGVAGSGNNAGDLLVMARVLHEWGRDVSVIVIGSSRPDSSLALSSTFPIHESGSEAERVLASADVIVDGMLGTGAQGAPRGAVGGWITMINATSLPVVALDMPSGVDATTGRVFDDVINASVTICFGWPKLGLMLQPARAHCGRLVAVEIGFPHDVLSCDAAAITSGWARARIKRRAAGAHKNSAGRLLLLTGSDGMAGAAVLATEGALRAGAGQLRIASWSGNREILQSTVPEATFIDRDALDESHTESMHALVAGPGLGMDAAAADALDNVLAQMPSSATLLDADALNIFAREPDRLRDLALTRDLVITPHVKELSRLTGTAVDAILADPVGAARDAARAFSCTVLLKGQPSIVARPDGRIMVGTTGSSDVATAGMGDQLAGTIGALLVVGHTTADAAALGLFLCGRAADMAARGVSLSPRDVSAHLANAIADPGPASSPLDLPFVTFDQSARR